jgi:thiamine pyrophosphate-dependent acetolactate synthase large subunit-like protein
MNCQSPTLAKLEAVGAVIAAFPSAPIVFSTGYISRMAHHLRDGPNHFYMVGSMGLAASIGAGIAAASRRQTVVVDGDGSFLMGLNGLLLHDDLPGAENLVHVVLNDGEYDSTGGQAVPASSQRISDLARAAGYAEVHDVEDSRALQQLLRLAATMPATGPVLIHCSVVPSHTAPPRIEVALPDITTRMQRFLTGHPGHPVPHTHTLDHHRHRTLSK